MVRCCVLVAAILSGLAFGQPAAAPPTTTAPTAVPATTHRDPTQAFEEALAPIKAEAATKGMLLPPDVRQRVANWQKRLETARVMKVTCDLRQDWRYLDEVDDKGTPVAFAHEQFEAHAWMAPNSSWLVVFASHTNPDGTVTADHDKPLLQQLWRDGMVWERVWHPEHDGYRVVKYPEPTAHGPENSGLDTKGCIYGTVLGSWLADGGAIAETQWLRRNPRPQVACPFECPDGAVWLLGFDTIMMPAPAKGPTHTAYVDYVLLSPDNEMVRWCTRAISCKTARPEEIVADRRLTYQFFEHTPNELNDTMEGFVSLVEAELPSASGTTPKP